MTRSKTPSDAPARARAPRKTAGRAIGITTQVATFTQFIDPEKRAALIAEAAYFRAEKRGFAPGRESADWLAAESEVDGRLMKADSPPRV